MYASVGMVTINVIGNLYLVPTYGIVDAAWATAVAYVFNAGIKAWLMRGMKWIGSYTELDSLFGSREGAAPE